jgi:diphthamide biosynthesis methyltransferase
MLYLIGLGLSDETDITARGLEIVRKASRVYLEAYTSILLVDKNVLVCPYPGGRKEKWELTLIYSRRNIMAGR